MLKTEVFNLPSVLVLLASVALIGCATSTVLPSPPPAFSLPTAQPHPDFIRCVSPEESSVIPMSVYRAEHAQVIGIRKPEDGYASTVCVNFSLASLVQSGDDFTDDVVLERVNLEVDGVTRPPAGELYNAGLLWSKGPPNNSDAQWGGPYTLCWQVPVDVGIHQAHFQFRQTSGDIQEYVWYFAVIED